jgi:nickel-type superoxide dismutase maturation protease
MHWGRKRCTAWGIVAGTAAAMGACWAACWLLERVEVEGTSMLPTFQAGDRLLVRRVGRRVLQARPGDLVLVRDPRDPRRRLVKRLARMTPAGVVVLGDNPPASTDSRTYGPLSLGALRGKVFFRYAPPARVGRLG